MLNYEYSFEIKPGKLVYIQREDALVRGRILTSEIEERYRPSRLFFHFRRRGGHVGAMRVHLENEYFSRFDLENFFGHVTRTKVVRALRNIGWSRKDAFAAAWDASVVAGGKATIPFGFHQSPLLATLVLEQSKLGLFLADLRSSGFTVSVYMDDILISSRDKVALIAASEAMEKIAEESGFPLSTQKTAVAVNKAEVFNCVVAPAEIRFLDHRMAKFIADHGLASAAGKDAIERYIEAVSNDELEVFFSNLDAQKTALPSKATVKWFAPSPPPQSPHPQP